MVKFSVVIPAYNSVKYLNTCIESLYAQHYPNLEIVVVDDGSTDNTLRKLWEYNNIKFISMPNGGVSSARTVGLQNAEGDYIMFLDSDDYMPENTINSIAKVMEDSGMNPDIIQFPATFIYSDGIIVDETPMYPDGTLLLKEDFREKVYKKIITTINFNSLWRNVYKRELLQGMVFERKLKTAEDLMFNIEVFTRANNMLYTTKARYNYCLRADSITGSGLSVNEKIRCNRMVSKKMLTYLDTWGLNTPVYYLLTRFRVVTMSFLKVFRMILRKTRNRAEGQGK